MNETSYFLEPISSCIRNVLIPSTQRVLVILRKTYHTSHTTKHKRIPNLVQRLQNGYKFKVSIGQERSQDLALSKAEVIQHNMDMVNVSLFTIKSVQSARRWRWFVCCRHIEWSTVSGIIIHRLTLRNHSCTVPLRWYGNIPFLWHIKMYVCVFNSLKFCFHNQRSWQS